MTWLLIVIILTAGGMLEPQVFSMKDEPTCIKALPAATAIAEEVAKNGFVAACVMVAKAGV
jgi:hypothetical protein